LPSIKFKPGLLARFKLTKVKRLYFHINIKTLQAIASRTVYFIYNYLFTFSKLTQFERNKKKQTEIFQDHLQTLKIIIGLSTFELDFAYKSMSFIF